MKVFNLKTLFALSAGIALMGAAGCSSLPNMQDHQAYCMAEDRQKADEVDRMFSDFAKASRSYFEIHGLQAAGARYKFLPNLALPSAHEKIANALDRSQDFLSDRDENCDHPETSGRFEEFMNILSTYSSAKIDRLINDMK